ncbi:MAG TPA: emopamil-binding family protein [Thermomonospora sp.]|nr:emopamil-binding family protein [Thermomonospora sp.]
MAGRHERGQTRNGRRLSREDRVSITLLLFFVLMAVTIELYFVVHHRDLPQRDDLFARLYEIYGAGDQAYYGRGDVHVPFALETINVFVTQVLNGILIWAIVRRRPYRHPLQLAVSSYVAYSVVLYFWIAHVSGYPGMPEKDWWGYLIFYAPNLPWLLGHLYLAHRSFGAIVRQFAPRSTEPSAVRHPGRGGLSLGDGG